MKHKIYMRLSLIWLVLVLVIKPLSAQKGLWYGVSGGVQNTYLRSWIRSEIDAKNAIRPVILFNLEYQFSSGASIQSGIGYSLYTQNTSKFKNNFNYLTIPLYLKGGSFKNGNRYALSYFCGINSNFLISAQNIYQGGKNDIKEYTMNFHQDLVFGCGIKHKISDNIMLETYLTGAVGGYINKTSFDGFALINMNYGALISLKYQFKKK
jgi:hypothetical protein